MNFHKFNILFVNGTKTTTNLSYWSEKLETLIQEPIKLAYQPSGPLGFYKKEFSIELELITDDSLLNTTKANFILLFTSNVPDINLEKVVNPKINNETHAANITVEVQSGSGGVLASIKKTLWRNASVKASGNTEYLRLII